MSEEQQAREAMAAIPLLSGYRGPVNRLGGLTNLVFQAGEHCLRIPGKGTEEYINRANEAVAAREAAKAGVSPEVLHFDAAGVMVTRFIDGAQTMSPAAFKLNSGRAGASGRGAAKAACLGRRVPVPLRPVRDDRRLPQDPVDQGRRAARGLSRGGARSRGDPHGAVGASGDRSSPAIAIRCARTSSIPGDRMWIVDWEYSGMNDPMWDLGDLSVEGKFDEEQEEEMLRAYFAGEPRPAERGRIVIYKAMCDLLWTLWGLIQLANDNPADDFRAYADGRFARCRKLMQGADFARHLEAVRKG